MGAAFGPALLLTVLGRSITPSATLMSMVAGFATAVGAHFVPGDDSGKWLPRMVPFVISFAIAFSGSRPARQ